MGSGTLRLRKLCSSRRWLTDGNADDMSRYRTDVTRLGAPRVLDALHEVEDRVGGGAVGPATEVVGRKQTGI